MKYYKLQCYDSMRYRWYDGNRDPRHFTSKKAAKKAINNIYGTWFRYRIIKCITTMEVVK